MFQTGAVLDHVRIAAKCHADWKLMEGDDRSRFCGACEKYVYNIASMTAAEVEALIQEREGRLCIRLFRRSDGTVMTSDCPVGARAFCRRATRFAAAGAVGAALVVGGVLLPNLLHERSSRARFGDGPVAQKVLVLWDDFLIWAGFRQPRFEMGAVCVPRSLGSNPVDVDWEE